MAKTPTKAPAKKPARKPAANPEANAPAAPPATETKPVVEAPPEAAGQDSGTSTEASQVPNPEYDPSAITQPTTDPAIAAAPHGSDALTADGADETLVIPADHAPLVLEGDRSPTEAEMQAISDHVELRVAELVSYVRGEAARYGFDARHLARRIGELVEDALDPDEDED